MLTLWWAGICGADSVVQAGTGFFSSDRTIKGVRSRHLGRAGVPSARADAGAARAALLEGRHRPRRALAHETDSALSPATASSRSSSSHRSSSTQLAPHYGKEAVGSWLGVQAVVDEPRMVRGFVVARSGSAMAIEHEFFLRAPVFFWRRRVRRRRAVLLGVAVSCRSAGRARPLIFASSRANSARGAAWREAAIERENTARRRRTRRRQKNTARARKLVLDRIALPDLATTKPRTHPRLVDTA